MNRGRAERLALRFLADWTRQRGGAVFELTASREGRTHWVFGVGALSADVHHGGPPSVVVEKRSGEVRGLAFWPSQAALGVLSVAEVQRFLEPHERELLAGLLEPDAIETPDGDGAAASSSDASPPRV